MRFSSSTRRLSIETLTQRRPSKAGTFLSLTLVIEATGPEQLEALHKDLMATGRVSMVI